MHNSLVQYRLNSVNISDPVLVEIKHVETGDMLEMTISEVITDKEIMGGLPSRDALLVNAWNGD